MTFLGYPRYPPIGDFPLDPRIPGQPTGFPDFPTGGGGGGDCSIIEVDLPFGQRGVICGPNCECANGGLSVAGIGAVCLGACRPRGTNGTGFDEPVTCPGGFEPATDPITGQVTCREIGGTGELPGGTEVPQQPTTNGCPPIPRCNERFVMVGRPGCQRRIRQRQDTKTGRWKQVRRMNPMNADANRRSISRLKGAHREAKKIINTLDGFAKPRKRRAATRSCRS